MTFSTLWAWEFRKNSLERKIKWEEIKKRLCEYQAQIPQLKAIGWDVALTENGPVIIEINNYWDTTGQLFLGRGWRDEVQECYEAWKEHYK